MTSKSPVRSCEDVDETALSFAEIKALCAGNPLIAEKMNLDIEVTKLRMLKAEHQSQRYRLEDNLMTHYPRQVASVTERIAGTEKDIAHYAERKEKCVSVQATSGGASASVKSPGMTINGATYREKEPAAKALRESCKLIKDKEEIAVGDYMGFKMSLQYKGVFDRSIILNLRGAMTHQVELSSDAFGNITRINNALDKLPERLDSAKQHLEDINKQIEAAKLELEKPFMLADELAEKEARLALINADLNIDGNGDFDVINDDERESGDEAYDGSPGDSELDTDSDRAHTQTPQAASEKIIKPSILDGIRNYSGNNNQSIPGRDKPVGIAI